MQPLALLTLLLAAGPALAAELDEETVRVRREAVRERVRQPVLLEAPSFKLYLDRRDGAFRIDPLGGLGWNSPIGRRGFASVLLPDPDGKGEPREVPIDVVEGLRATTRAIRFTGRSSVAEVPDLRFTLNIAEPLVGLRIAVDADPEFLERGGAVKLLDRALWIADVDEGGALIPVGLGEWLPGAHAADVKRRLSPSRGVPGSLDGASPDAAPGELILPTLDGLGLMRGEVALLVRWDHPETLIEVESAAPGGVEFPGARGIFTSVTLRGEARSITLYPIGRLRHRSELPAAYAELVGHGRPLPSLRYKSGFTDRHRDFPGAAIFPIDLSPDGGNVTASSVRATAGRMRDELGIDQALFLLREPDDEDRKDDLARLATELRELGYLVGVELTIPQRGEAPAAESGAVEAHVLRTVATFRPDLLMAPAGAGDLWGRHEELASDLTEDRVLLGAPFVHERQAIVATWLDGVIDHKVLGRDTGLFSPFFLAVHGSGVRLTARSAGPLRPGQPERFLAHVLLGEVPRYVLPPPAQESRSKNGDGASADTAAPFASVTGGWGDGRGLGVEERFLKNTYEVLSHVARIRHRNPILDYRTLDTAGLVEEAYFGFDLRIVINRGAEPWEDPEGDFTLPRHGFWVQHPFFVAFHATRAFGTDLGAPALFTIRSLEGKLWLRAESVRIWHGFGPSTLQLGGKRFDVEREVRTKIW